MQVVPAVRGGVVWGSTKGYIHHRVPVSFLPLGHDECRSVRLSRDARKARRVIFRVISHRVLEGQERARLDRYQIGKREV